MASKQRNRKCEKNATGPDHETSATQTTCQRSPANKEATVSPKAIQTAIDSRIAQLENSTQAQKIMEKKRQSEISAAIKDFRTLLDRVSDKSSMAEPDLLDCRKKLFGAFDGKVKRIGTLETKYKSACNEKIVNSIELKRTRDVLNQVQELADKLKDQNQKLLTEREKLIADEAAYRVEMKDKFEVSLKDISERIEKHNDTSIKQAEENDRLRLDVEKYVNQANLREEAFRKQMELRDKEREMYDEARGEFEKALTAQSEKYQQVVTRLATSLEQEKNLHEQLRSYSQKFDEVQETIGHSSKVFADFKKSNAKYAKKAETLQRENNEFTKHNKRLTSEVIAGREEKAKLVNQKECLSRLCRKLQDQRRANLRAIDDLGRRVADLERLAGSNHVPSSGSETEVGTSDPSCDTIPTEPLPEGTQEVDPAPCQPQLEDAGENLEVPKVDVKSTSSQDEQSASPRAKYEPQISRSSSSDGVRHRSIDEYISAKAECADDSEPGQVDGDIVGVLV
eukprot:217103_1